MKFTLFFKWSYNESINEWIISLERSRRDKQFKDHNITISKWEERNCKPIDYQTPLELEDQFKQGYSNWWNATNLVYKERLTSSLLQAPFGQVRKFYYPLGQSSQSYTIEVFTHKWKTYNESHTTKTTNLLWRVFSH